MLTVTVLCGIPASGKSTWTKDQLKKDPNTIRVNNDDLRLTLHNGVFSTENEKLIISTRSFLIRKALESNKNVIIDNLNINKRNFDDVCSIAKSINKDIMVMERVFYIDLEEAIERDKNRKASVGESVIKEWWKKSGGKQLKFKNPKKEIFLKQGHNSTHEIFEPAQQDKNLPKAIIVDNDGTLSLIHPGRSPYDASTADQDIPHEHVIEMVKLYHNSGYKILFLSGREEKDRAPTERFYQKYLPEVKYELFMRPTGDSRKDVIIKEEIYNNYIKNKYFISAWVDDRLQVVKWVYENKLPLFRVGNPEASF